MKKKERISTSTHKNRDQNKTGHSFHLGLYFYIRFCKLRFFLSSILLTNWQLPLKHHRFQQDFYRQLVPYRDDHRRRRQLLVQLF